MRMDELGPMAPREVAELHEAWEKRERRADYRAGVLAMILAETNRDREENPKPFHPADFFPSLETTRPELEEIDVPSKVEEFFLAFGGMPDREPEHKDV